MSKEKESIGFLLFLFLLLPWLMTVLLQGRQACPVEREISIEEYIAAVTASQISWDYDMEAIKAQTILVRNALYLTQEQGKEQELLLQASDFFKRKEMDAQQLMRFHSFQQAAQETKGEVLALEGEVKELPYHALSQGRTRDGKEVLGEDYTYLPSVDTSRDLDSPRYVEGCYFTAQELAEKLKEEYPGFVMDEAQTVEIKETDAAGYVIEVQIGTQIFQGEKIKELLALPSSCFTVQKLEGEIRFLCRGIGHGMGMSQYTAQQLALEGKTYIEILQYFFPDLEIVDNL